MRLLKRIVEMIFIFILPILLLLCTFKKSYVYDSNNNVVSERLQFDNIFSISEGDVSYIYYEYYDLNEHIIVTPDDSIQVNYNVSPYIYFYLDYANQYYTRLLTFGYSNDTIYSVDVQANTITSTTIFDIETSDYGVYIIRNSNDYEIINKFGNIVKDIKSITIRDNIVNKGITIIFSYLGISDNIVMQLLVVYVLLVLIMLLVWYVIYVPFDMLFGLLLRKLEYYK